jgi:hypothetical protein
MIPEVDRPNATSAASRLPRTGKEPAHGIGPSRDTNLGLQKGPEVVCPHRCRNTSPQTLRQIIQSLLKRKPTAGRFFRNVGKSSIQIALSHPCAEYRIA